MNNMKSLLYSSMIPKEMFWGYEAVRQSGLYNMCCIQFPMVCNNHSDRSELKNIIDECYIRYCTYTNADITKAEYKHVTYDHIFLIQRHYNLLLESYGLPPDNVVNIKRETTVTI